MQKGASLFLFLAMLPGLIPHAAGQTRTWINVDAGPRWSMVKVDDPGNTFQSVSILSSTVGLSLEQQISGPFSVSAGLFLETFHTGMAMEDGRPHRQRLETWSGYLLPVRFHYSIRPGDYPVYFTPHLGYILRFGAAEPSDLFSHRGLISGPGGTAYSYVHERVDEQPGMHLLELGLGAGIRFKGDWQASARLSWASGLFNPASDLARVEYDDLQGTARTATYNSKGNTLSGTLAVHLPLSNIWQNRDYRIRSRIEHGTFDGKRIDRKGSFYAGGDVGVLWRLFHSSDPALAARPMEDRGFLRYANLNTGLYAGFMPGNELGVDLGVYYRRSSGFYSLMYDHEVDFAGRSAAPLYLEIPVRVRYFYEVLENRLDMVLTGGVSALTRFTAEYEAPGGTISYTLPGTQSPASAEVTATAHRQSSVRPLLRMGLGAEYRLPMEFPLLLTLHANYAQGFLPVEEIRVSTTMATDPSTHTLDWDGSGWSIDLGVKIPLAFDDREDCVRLTREKRIR